MRLPRERPQSTYFDVMRISTLSYGTVKGVMCIHANLLTSKLLSFRLSRIKSVIDESIFIQQYIERRGIKVDGYSVIFSTVTHIPVQCLPPKLQPQTRLLSISRISRVISCKLYLSFTNRAALTVSCRSGMPKKTELYIFFDIVDVKKFRHRLLSFIPKIKTVAGVLNDRKKIDEHKKNKVPGWLKLSGVNISFSHKGFVKVSQINNME